MSELSSFEKWCHSKLMPLMDQPLTIELGAKLMRYNVALDVLKEFQHAVDVHSQKGKVSEGGDEGSV